MLTTHIKQTIIHKILSKSASYLRKAADSTQPEQVNVYVDLDNLLGNFKDKDKLLYKNITFNIDSVLIEIAKDYLNQRVVIYVYGNLKYHQLIEKTIPTPNGEIIYKDMPVLTSHGKTTTDMLMGVDILEQATSYVRCALVTNDVDFKHVIQSLNKQGTPVDLIKYGYTHYQLDNSADSVKDGFKYLIRSSSDNKLIATYLLKQAIHDAKNICPASIALKKLEHFASNNWQGFNSFAGFVGSLSITNLKIIPTNGSSFTIEEQLRKEPEPIKISANSIEEVMAGKLTKMNIPNLDENTYDTLFDQLNDCNPGAPLAITVKRIYKKCHQAGLDIGRTQIKQIISQIRPYLNKPNTKNANRTDILKHKYLESILKKAAVNFNDFLNDEERDYMTSRVLG